MPLAVVAGATCGGLLLLGTRSGAPTLAPRQLVAVPIRPAKPAQLSETVKASPAGSEVKSGIPLPAIRGLVVSSESKPLSGVMLYFANLSETVVRRSATRYCTSDDAGLFRLEIPEECPDSVVAWRQGYLPLVLRRSDLEIRARQGLEERLVLESGQSIGGTVRDLWGNPVPGVLVEALGVHGKDISLMKDSGLPGPSAGFDYQPTYTDESGKFLIRGIGMFPMWLTAKKIGYVDFTNGVDNAVMNGASDIVLLLSPQCRVGVKLLDSVTREPVRVASIQLYSERPDDRPGLASSTLVAAPATGQRDGWGEDGATYWASFRVADARTVSRTPIPTVVEVTACGFRPARVTAEARFPDDPRWGEAQEILLQRSDVNMAWGTLKVRVHYSNGQPVRFACIAVDPDDEQFAATESGGHRRIII